MMQESLPEDPNLRRNLFGNRAERRKNRSLQTSQESILAGQYNKHYNLLGETINEWSQIIDEQDHQPTKVIYRGRPFISRWLEVRRELPIFLERAQTENKGSVTLSQSAIKPICT